MQEAGVMTIQSDGLAGSAHGSHKADECVPGAYGLARVPLPAILVVFAPIVLTSLTYMSMSAHARSVLAARPMSGFLIYMAWNWVVICSGYLLVRRLNITWKDLGFTNFRLRDMGLAVMGALIGLCVVYPLSTFIVKLLGLPPMHGMNYSLTDVVDIVSALVTTVLLGSLAEDILFRGFLLSTLRVRIRNLWCVGSIGVIMFTLIHLPHFGWAGIIFILLWSPLTVGLFLLRRSIYPSYVMHVLNNLFAYVIVPLFLRG
jgi:membrane protease YdiL (CAAX protease family)